MKFNIEIELDWMDEGYELDEVLKSQISKEIVKKVSDKAIENFENSASNKIKNVYDKIESKIDALVTKEFNQIIKKPVVQTDKWGDIKKEYKTVKEMIKTKFDNWLMEKVDERGNPSSYGKFTRMNYFIDYQLSEFSKNFSKETVKEMREKLTSVLNNDMKELLGSQMMDVIGVKELLSNASNKALKG